MLVRRWIVFGAFAGIIGDLAYVLAIAPLGLSPKVVTLFGFVFGPLLSLAFVGIYHFFKVYKKTVVIQASMIFGVIAGTIVNMMIVVQSAIFVTIPNETRAGMGLAWDGLNMVQLGLDVSWDIYISAATILLGVAMCSHPRYGKIWGILTIVIGAALLILNVATFPVPPSSAGLFDLGPITGILYLIIVLRMITSLKWVDQALISNSGNHKIA